MNTFLEVVFVILVLYIVYWFKNQLRFRKILNQFPGRQCNPILGDVMNFSLQRGNIPIMGAVYLHCTSMTLPGFPETKTALYTYADDTAIYGHSYSVELANKQLQIHLSILQPYWKSWKISINPTKTVTIVFTYVLFQQLREIVEEFPDGCRFLGGPYGGFIFTRPEDIEVILSSSRHLEKSVIYDSIHNWLGTGLLTSTDKKWAQRRKILTSAFHFSILRRFVTVFSAHSETFIEELRGECNKQKTDIVPIISSLALNIICETAMGINVNSCDEKFIDYKKAVHGIGALIVKRIFHPWLYSDIIYFLTPHGRQERKYIKTLHQFSTEVIKKRETTFSETDLETMNNEEDDVGIYSKKRFAMLDLLLLAKKQGKINNEGIREEVDTFMFEGHDTVSVALSFCLFTLANHKHVQEKARAEIDEIFNGSTRSTSYQDLQNMHYLEMVIKETMRLYPSVPIILRRIIEDVPFRNGKHTIPKGSDVGIFIYDLHRNAQIFPEPEKFDPDRFLPENVKDRHAYAYIPFSAGPRNCIGQKFAILEMKCVLSAILRHYEMEPVDTIESLTLIVDLVLRPKDTMHVRFKRRADFNN